METIQESHDFLHVVRHVFLPPQLPQQDDSTTSSGKALMKSILNAMIQFKRYVNPEDMRAFQSAIDMVHNLSFTRPSERLDYCSVVEAIRGLADGGRLVFELRAQNLALLISRDDNVVQFEPFELLAENKQVIACTGRLRRIFPACCIELDYPQYQVPQFQAALVNMLCRLDAETHSSCRPHSNKQGENDEERDSIIPRMIGPIVGFLRGLGKETEVRQLIKNSREEVLWHDAKLPWHRSAVWLLIRVTLQLSLSRQKTEQPSCQLYKEFIIFFVSTLIEQATKRHVSDELLYCMIAKFHRRWHKFSRTPETSSYRPAWLSYSSDILEKAAKGLESNWESIIRSCDTRTLQLEPLKDLDFANDTFLRLAGLQKFVDITALPKVDSSAAHAPEPGFDLAKFDEDEVPVIKNGQNGSLNFILATVEQWVGDSLLQWLQSHVTESNACKRLAELLDSYVSAAGKQYERNPHNLSVMWLCVMELWVACDQAATQQVPLLLNYSIGFPEALLEPLVLPLQSHMSRLRKIERYLKERDSRAHRGYPSAFEGFGQANSFAARYYDSSDSHQRLYREIISHAEKDRKEKEEELRQRREEYEALKRQSDGTAHDQEVVGSNYDGWTTQCRYSCSKCSLETEMSHMRITVHEWPLPNNDIQAHSVIFELQVPSIISDWRRVTMTVLVDLLQDSRQTASGDDKCYSPLHYTELAMRAWGGPQGRLGLASQVKPFTHSHYRDQPVSEASIHTICKMHGCRYTYHDKKHSYPVSELIESSKIPSNCSFAAASRLPLPDWIRGYSHTSNEVIAQQSACPANMALDEFKAIGHMRSGARLQWWNLLVQLYAPIVDLNNIETALVVLQAIGEGGPCVDDPDSHLRDAHAVVQDEAFARKFLDGLQIALLRFRENWECDTALFILASLCNRVMALANSEEIWSACCHFGRQIRSVACHWANTLLNKRAETDSEVERSDLNDRILAMALVSSSTFDTDTQHADRVLHDGQSVTEFLEASILIHDHQLPDSCSLSPAALVSLQAWRRLCYRYQTNILTHIALDRSCIDRVVLRFWANYKPGSAWECPRPQRTHVVASTSSSKSQRVLVVSMDILQGRLLVNGRSLSRLPEQYGGHPAYARLFGSQVLEIAPSDEPGLDYTAVRKQQGWIVHFGMANEELIIRACANGSTWEFVPPWFLRADLPNSLILPYSHWRNTQTGELELRDVGRPWSARDSLWRSQGRPRGHVTLVCGDMSLIEPTSCTAKKICDVFSPIEAASFITISLLRSSATLLIDLCRLNLSFTLQAGNCCIRSQKHPGMRIDSDQSLSTLIGLRNRLVLRPQSSIPNKKRMVIIPHGTFDSRIQVLGEDVLIHPETTVQFPQRDMSVQLQFPRSVEHRKHHRYEIDNVLGYLVDNGSLQSMLLLCYLHAVTANCLQDPLTSRTGTEEALRILKSAAVMSFERLQEEDIELLWRIARLSPARAFYPKHLCEMQQIRWSNKLHSLSQHDEFSRTVEAILNEGKYQEMFFPENAQPVKVPEGFHPQLRRRALHRSSCFRVDGFGAEQFCRSDDMDYRGRDFMELSSTKQLEQRVCEITRSLLLTRQTVLSKVVDAQNLVSSLYAMFGNELADCQGDSLFPIGHFSIHWLGKPSSTIGKYWLAIQRHLTTVQLAGSRYDLMTFFAALAYADKAHLDIVQLLLALVCATSLRDHQHPSYSCYKLEHGHVYQRGDIRWMIESHNVKFTSTPESNILARDGEKPHELQNRRNQAWQSKISTLVRGFEASISQHSLNDKPYTPHGNEFSRYFDVPSIMGCIRDQFHSWNKNSRLHSYLVAIVEATASLPENPVTESFLERPAQILTTSQINVKRPFVTADKLFHQEPPPVSCGEADRLQDIRYRHTGSGNHADSNGEGASKPEDMFLPVLQSLAVRRYEKDYVQEFETSFSSYRAMCTTDSNMLLAYDRGELEVRLVEHIRACEAQVDQMQRLIYSHLHGTLSADFPCLIHCLPRLSPVFILERLNRHHWSSIPNRWKLCIEQYALALSHCQRAKRMLGVIDDRMELTKEVENIGHAWNLRKFPEWLLLEIESGLIIRDVQEEVASSMGGCSENRVMQLNMGEGKSSVIVPIVAAHLADGNRLVRVIIAKPQSKQMRHMLVSKLGGLLDRRVFSLPFSRSIVMDRSKLDQIQSRFETCRESGGILLVQPEQLLSFKLMGLEYVGSSACLSKPTDAGTGSRLIQSQRYLETYSRDIIDESDENFNVKFELIYTIGGQGPIDMSPDRWIVIQQVLDIIRRLAPEFADQYPEGFELEREPLGRFPRLRFLKERPASLLLESAARRVCEKGLHRFPIAHQTPETRQSVLKYITVQDLTGDEIRFVEADSGSFFCDSTRNVLFLLRGLFACRVLDFAFAQKRWRVNYGLAKRVPPTQLAVPYRAKDSPALRSEFSHPDVVIILTQLSYYYGGLSDDEMFTAFQKLDHSDQASTVYGEWVDKSLGLAPSFRQLPSVNLKDRSQCIDQIFPALRYTTSVVDFYLEKAVFPHKMVEFPQKLSASGWDLAKSRAQAVTGFSGTCDSKCVLPLDIAHTDLPAQRHTNAKVLDYVLRSENLVVNLGHGIHGASLLEAVVSAEPPIDVVLDVGALIIDMDNRQVAQKWLELTTDRSEKQAVIFVNEDDEITVIDRNGFVEPFLTSSFVDNTGCCLVYLDEAHTRGIDLKLPHHYRAATTLGPRLTKDRLVQACIRMRKLGKGQSISFFIPVEIQDKIRTVRSLGEDAPITVSDVLVWAISETWSDTYKSMPLWAMQGLRHQRQEAIWAAHIDTNEGQDLRSSDIVNYLEDEAMSLRQRYHPTADNTSKVLSAHSADPQLAQRQEQLRLIEAKCEQFQIGTFGSAALQEEQERELAPETEQERQVEHPRPRSPLQHTLHPSLCILMNTGFLDLSGDGFARAFTSFKKCSAAPLANLLREFDGNLLVTGDFTKTVRLSRTANSDASQRPVQWVLTTKESVAGTYMIILSPFEANLLLPSIKNSLHVTLHVYAPRINLSFPCLQDLKLYSAPALPAGWIVPYHLVQQLNLFSGQLYFQDLQEYQQLCAHLGLSCTGNDGSTEVVAVDGFIGKGVRYPRCQFTRSPAAFLHFVMANVRRDRQDIGRTHVGRMLNGEVLTADDFSAY